MSTDTGEARGVDSPLANLTKKISGVGLRLVALAIFDAFAIWFLLQLINDGVWSLAIIIGLLTLGVNLVNLREDLYPLRWLTPGLSLLILMALYPILFTAYTAFTNYSDGHLLTKQQLIGLLGREQYLPEGAPAYDWTAYRSQDGEFALWLTSENGAN